MLWAFTAFYGLSTLGYLSIPFSLSIGLYSWLLSMTK